ncbi:MAG: hypothetical protein KZQ83_03070 [gamma proteobacterium symbiont of Taylorina sp.]|nr:hypothetical protein [gamma proteobacterium symbiont of Taylorina sp.]
MIDKTLIKHKIVPWSYLQGKNVCKATAAKFYWPNALISVLMFLALSMPVIANADRQSAELPSHVSKHLMSTMRNNLESLAHITYLLADSKYAEAADMAENNLGMSSMEIHFKKFVGKYLPKGMRKISKQMHKAASDFALSARETEKDGDVNRSFSALSQVMNQCVACHDLYRVNRAD